MKFNEWLKIQEMAMGQVWSKDSNNSQFQGHDKKLLDPSGRLDWTKGKLKSLLQKLDFC
jgi:hypothetical protein